MNKVLFLLGANLGNRKETLLRAIELLKERIGNRVRLSSFYETAPWGGVNQAPFLNLVVELYANLEPLEVLEGVLEIETMLGRVRNEKWSARTIDIDLLYFNQAIIILPTLKIPHPYLHERRFTLIPLCELAGNLKHPVLNLTNAQLLDSCQDQGAVELFE